MGTFGEMTTDEALALLREIVSERPDGYRYEKPGQRCVYLHDGEPSCLIGHFFARLGVSTETLAALDADLDGDGLDAGAAAMQLGFSTPVADLLNNVQARQDQKYTWTEAVDRGEL